VWRSVRARGRVGGCAPFPLCWSCFLFFCGVLCSPASTHPALPCQGHGIGQTPHGPPVAGCPAGLPPGPPSRAPVRVVNLEGGGGGGGGEREREREGGGGGRSQLPVPVYVILSSSMRYIQNLLLQKKPQTLLPVTRPAACHRPSRERGGGRGATWRSSSKGESGRKSALERLEGRAPIGVDDHGTFTNTTTTTTVGCCCCTCTPRGRAHDRCKNVSSPRSHVRGKRTGCSPSWGSTSLGASRFIGRCWEPGWVRAGLSSPFVDPLPCRLDYFGCYSPELARARGIGNGLVPLFALRARLRKGLGLGPALTRAPPFVRACSCFAPPAFFFPFPFAVPPAAVVLALFPVTGRGAITM
jgi:hypothetical protein